MDRGNLVLDIEPAQKSSGVANTRSSQSAISQAASTRKSRSTANVRSAVTVTFGKPVELDLKGRALEAMLANDSLVGYRTADLGVPDAPVLGR